MTSRAFLLSVTLLFVGCAEQPQDEEKPLAHGSDAITRKAEENAARNAEITLRPRRFSKDSL